MYLYFYVSKFQYLISVYLLFLPMYWFVIIYVYVVFLSCAVHFIPDFTCGNSLRATQNFIPQYIFSTSYRWYWGFPAGSEVKKICDAGDCLQRKRWGLIPGSRRFPGERNGNPLQYSYLGNPIDRGVLKTNQTLNRKLFLRTQIHDRAGLYLWMLRRDFFSLTLG